MCLLNRAFVLFFFILTNVGGACLAKSQAIGNKQNAESTLIRSSEQKPFIRMVERKILAKKPVNQAHAQNEIVYLFVAFVLILSLFGFFWGIALAEPILVLFAALFFFSCLMGLLFLGVQGGSGGSILETVLRVIYMVM